MPAVYHSALAGPSSSSSSTLTGSSTSQNAFASTSSLPDQVRRSPTPLSAISYTTTTTVTTSKFLLHVIPPLHLPHETDATDEYDYTPLPHTASGYHTHFRRGTLVPVHSTLQSQLASIAKEYALPSTAGLVLYLVSSDPAPTSSENGTPVEYKQEEPGPRISEEIWRHIWTRVIKAERDDAPARSVSPLTLGAGALGRSLSSAMASSPSLMTDPHRPLISHNKSLPGPPHTPSTPPDIRIHTKSNSSSLSHSNSLNSSSTPEPDTPDTSIHSESRSGSFDLPLPGLKSPSLIPVLAKVEFDIDKKRAGWYQPWCRSRKNNRSKKPRRVQNSEVDEGSTGEERAAPFDLKLVKRMQSPAPFLRDMAQSDDSDSELEKAEDAVWQQLEDVDIDDDNEKEEDDEEEENNTARIMSVPGGPPRDPLADVFGSDGESWAALRRESRASTTLRDSSNPNIVNLALTAEALAELPTDSELERTDDVDETREVREIITRSRQSSGATSLSRSGSRKQPPPPLTIEPMPLVPPAETSARTDSGEDTLAYLQPSAASSGSFNTGELPPPKTAESVKRTGGVYDDFDLGLDELDDDDPDDRRKSQFLMREALDKIEQNLAQFSPRPLQANMEEEQSPLKSGHSRAKSSISPLRNHDVFPPTPRSASHPETSPNSPPRAAWPAVPYSSIVNTEVEAPPPSTPAPPQLALNGVTTAAPRAYKDPVPAQNHNDARSESAMRKREMDEIEAYTRPRRPPTPSSANFSAASSSPVIPLSPDPFGRFSSSVYEDTPIPEENIHSSVRNSLSYWDSVPVGIPSAPSGEGNGHRRQSGTSNRKSQTSRFSADSSAGEIQPPPLAPLNTKAAKLSNGSGLNAVKSIKKLWRKSNKNSISSPASPVEVPALPTRSSKDKESVPRTSKDFLSRAPKEKLARTSQESARTSNDGGLSVPSARSSRDLQTPTPPPPPTRSPPPPPFAGSGPPQPQVTMMRKSNPGLAPPPPIVQHMHGFGGLQFNQETPYPIPRRSPTPSASMLPPPPLSPVMEGMSMEQQGPPLPSPSSEAPPSRPRSILKSRKGSVGSISDSSTASASRSRRPSVGSRAPSHASMASIDVPPSPALPEQFINPPPVTPLQPHSVVAPLRVSSRSLSSESAESNGSSSAYHQQQQAIIAKSRRPSVSSKASEESRPSFDVSQFEIVSPKMVNSTLVYPYTTLDQGS
jgi:hypothetical protein